MFDTTVKPDCRIEMKEIHGVLFPVKVYSYVPPVYTAKRAGPSETASEGVTGPVFDSVEEMDIFAQVFGNETDKE